jgi:hypothetical protein
LDASSFLGLLASIEGSARFFIPTIVTIKAQPKQSIMPKLYYTPVSCGAASFIAALAAGVKIDAEQVDIGTHVTNSGADYYSINTKGNVPCLVLDDGTVLNEGAAVLQYIADQVGSIPLHFIITHPNPLIPPRLPALSPRRTARARDISPRTRSTTSPARCTPASAPSSGP